MTSSGDAHRWDPQPDFAWLVALARRLARPGDDADDLAQETLLVAMRQPERASRPWLAGVLRNLGRMRARTDARRIARESGVVPTEPASAEDVLAQLETLDALRAALGELDAVDRTLVLGRYAAGQTAVVLGEQLELPASTVRTRLARAKEKLRRDVERARGFGCFMPWALADRGGTAGAVVGGVAMSTTTKIAIGAAALVLLGVGGRLVAVHTDATPAAASTTAVAPPEPAPPTSKVEPTAVRADDLRAKRDRIRAAREQRLAALASARPGKADDDDVGIDQCEHGCIGTLTLQILLANVMAACRDDLSPGAQGRTKFRAHVIAEPEAGAVVDAVEVIEDTVHDADFTECIVQSAPLVHLLDPENPVSESFVFRYSVGAPTQPTTEFLAAHPELLARHPEFAALARLEAGAEPSSEDATAFARWIEADADAQAIFTKWAADEGMDLANVKVEP